ncbi:RNA-directed DNA polymerase [Mycobacterium sp. OAE908]|uniref:RNA-directed DNA polymerase n=1 Tax=Mycobacterium sp. OAE908 TaxID=2817899 RepID=UPI001AE56B74
MQDRVVFEALVEVARPKIAKYLVSDESVLWPRADDSGPKWADFERRPTSMGGGFVISADIAGFYESVDHRRLALVLADAGVPKSVRDAIVDVAGDIMKDTRGLPQGVATSDVLATAYLSTVDSTLQRAGLEFWRHGDDYRVWAATYPDALSAMFQLEQAIRAGGLLLNTGKLYLQPLAEYTKHRNDIDDASSVFRERMKSAREQALTEASEEDLLNAAEKAQVDEDMQWRFFYHGTATLSEFLAVLAPSLTPKPIEIVAEMFTDLMNDEPDKLPGTLAHARLTFCIRRLAHAKSPAALPWVGKLLVTRADEVQDLANYMLALIQTEPNKVVAACHYALTNKVHMLDWERAWIYRTLSRRADLVHKSILAEARRIAESDASNWLARVEAVRLLARAGKLVKDTALQVAEKSPECFKGDIAGIIAMVERPDSWTSRYLDGARQDALEAVVIDAVREKVRSQTTAE